MLSLSPSQQLLTLIDGGFGQLAVHQPQEASGSIQAQHRLRLTSQPGLPLLPQHEAWQAVWSQRGVGEWDERTKDLVGQF